MKKFWDDVDYTDIDTGRKTVFTPRKRRNIIIAAVGVSIVLLIAVATVIGVAVARKHKDDNNKPTPAGPTTMVEAIDMERVTRHLQTLETLTLQNGGSRFVDVAFNHSAQFIENTFVEDFPFWNETIQHFEVSLNNGTKKITTKNLIIESRFGNPETVILVGSRLDSAPTSPGLNDNGSGSILNLELALALEDIDLNTVNKIRFAWWSAGELGSLGARYYLDSLSADELEKIVLYIDLDMVGSPNYFYGLYSGATANDQTRNGSLKIQEVFANAFTSRKTDFSLTPLDGKSDYVPFLEKNIPVGGLFTGSDGIKDAAGRRTYGGLANAPYDPCYRQVCDTFSNVNLKALHEMTLVAANAVETLLQKPDLVNFLKN